MAIPMKKYGLAGLTLTAALLATVLLVRLASATPDVPTDLAPFNGVTVSGTVAFPDGTLPTAAHPLTGTFVWLHQPDSDHDLDYDLAAYGRSNVISATGAFSFPRVAPGRYVLRAVPRNVPPFAYAPSLPIAVNVFTNTTVALTLTWPSVTGTVYAPDSLTPVSAIVHVYSETTAGKLEVERRWVWPENNGTFVIGGLPTGTFKFKAEPWADDGYWWSNPQLVDVTPAWPQNVSLTLKSPQVVGWVSAPAGAAYAPVHEATVRAITANGTQSDVTGRLGRYAIGDLPQDSVVTLTVKLPPEMDWLQPPRGPITTYIQSGPAAVVPITLTMPDRVVYGKVHTNEVISQPVSHALVQAHRVGGVGYNSTWTNNTGAYSLTLSPGLWAVQVRPVCGTQPGDWVYPHEARLVQFDEEPHAPKTKQLDFIVWVADATVVGTVRLPGNILPSTPNPPVSVTLELHNDEGIGLVQTLDTSGSYTFNVPHGAYHLDLRVESPLFAAPPPLDIHARPITPTVVPTITLWPRNALIVGTVTDIDTGAPVAGVPVIAWNPTTRATFSSRSDPSGVYALAVYSSTWLVRPAPLPPQPYVYTGGALSVQAIAWHVSLDKDFELTPANAAIHGVLVNESGHRVTGVRGWASAQDDGDVRTGAPLVEGQFHILVPGGTYTVTLHIPNGQAYLAQDNTQTTTVSSNMSSTVTFTLASKTARLWGDAHNVRTGTTAGRDVDGVVWAWDNGMWTGINIGPGNMYTLPVPAGDWGVDYVIDPDSEFVRVGGPRTYAVPSGAVQYAPLPVALKDSTLTGAVVLTDGITPARGAVVIAEAISADIAGYKARTPVDSSGRFAMNLPHGLYHVRSVLSHEEPRLINPRLATVNVPHGGSASVRLVYRWANAAITGIVALEGSPAQTGPVHVFAWTADDGYNTTVAPVNGVYTLPVMAGQMWKIAAVSESLAQYWITRTTVTAPATPGSIVHQDLFLRGPKPKPAPVVAVFDALQDQHLELAGGTRIYIPAGAMPATGKVVLHVTPLANAVRHRNGNVLGLSYVFEAFTEDGQPITANFNQDVLITFRYNLDELRELGLEQDHLRPAYFSTTTNSWTVPDGYVIDKTRREITLWIDHFTRFGVIGVESPSRLYLPLILNNATQ